MTGKDRGTGCVLRVRAQFHTARLHPSAFRYGQLTYSLGGHSASATKGGKTTNLHDVDKYSEVLLGKVSGGNTGREHLLLQPRGTFLCIDYVLCEVWKLGCWCLNVREKPRDQAGGA